MRLFFTAVYISCKRFLLAPLFLLVVLAAVVTQFVIAGTGGESIIGINVGVAYDSGNAYHNRIISGLEDTAVVSFVFYPDDDGDLELQVAKGNLECGYILTSALEEAMASGKRGSGELRLLRRPNSIAYPLTNGILYASILEQSTADISVNQLKSTLGGLPPDAEHYIRETVAGYLSGPDDTFVGIESTSVSPSPQEDTPQVPARAASGAIALSVLIAAGLFLPSLSGDYRRLARSMPFAASLRTLAGYLFTCLAGSLLVGIAGYIALVPAGKGMAVTGWRVALPSLLAYAWMVCAIGGLLAVLADAREFIYTLGTFVLLFTLGFGNVLFDWNELNQTIGGVVRCLPTGVLTGILSGTGSHSLPYLLYPAAAATAILPLAAWYQRKRG